MTAEATTADQVLGAPSANGSAPAEPEQDGGTNLAVTVVSLEDFIAVDEDGAEALVGDADSILIPEGGDVMIYGDGGAGKTTLSIDLACHLAAGDDWLEIPVARAARVLLIENEGPRPLLRKKLRRKVEAWPGAALGERVRLLEQPWAQFTFATEQWRAELARIVRDTEIDVVMVGPLSRSGMDAAGTLQEVAAFMDLIKDVREQSGRRLTVVLIHHENRAGTVSGAFEGSGDTLLHVTAAGNGHTVLFVQKARWASDRHQQTIKLAWTDGEGFELEADDRDLTSEITALLSDGRWRTVNEIRAKKEADAPGVGANGGAVRDALNGDPERFETCTGDAAKALGRPKTTVLWRLRGVTRAAESPESEHDFQGGGHGTDSVTPALKGVTEFRGTPAPSAKSDSAPESDLLATVDEETLLERARGLLDDGGSP
jgi:archaellum biogenesis ATPase FlaH